MMHRSSSAVRRTSVLSTIAFAPVLLASAASAQIFHDDWSGTPAGQLPDSVKVLNGGAVIATHRGSSVIRVLPTGRNFVWTVLEFRLNDMLPPDFTIEFDLHAPTSTSYPLEIRAGLAGDPLAYLGATARQNRVVANCGAVRTGIYGSLETTLTQRQDRFDTSAVRRCRIAVTGSRVEVGFHEVSLAQDNVDFKRSRRLVMVVPATAGMEAHIGPLTVSGATATTTVAPPTPPEPSAGTGSTLSGGAPTAPATGAPLPSSHRAGHVTGGGHISLPQNVRANFGFVVRGSGTAAPTGNFTLNWRGGGGTTHSFRGTAFTSFEPGQVTSFTGTGTLNGQAGYTFAVTVNESSPQTIRVQITPAAGSISDTGVRPIEGGNVTVHRQ